MDDNDEGSSQAFSQPQEGESLMEFITSHFEAQQADSRNAEDALNEDRLKRFYERAVSESQRMNSEISKSHSQRSALHAELGAERFEQWTHDHSLEVLTPQQYASWQRQERQTKKELSNQGRPEDDNDESSGEDISH